MAVGELVVDAEELVVDAGELVVDAGLAAVASALRQGSVTGGVHGGMARGRREAWGGCTVPVELGAGPFTMTERLRPVGQERRGHRLGARRAVWMLAPGGRGMASSHHQYGCWQREGEVVGTWNAYMLDALRGCRPGRPLSGSSSGQKHTTSSAARSDLVVLST